MAVHLRRGDLIGNSRFSRPVVSEAQLISGIEEVRKAVLISGENNGQPIVFHVFTQVRGSWIQLPSHGEHRARARRTASAARSPGVHRMTVLVKQGPFTREEKRLTWATCPLRFGSFTCSLGVHV